MRAFAIAVVIALAAALAGQPASAHRYIDMVGWPSFNTKPVKAAKKKPPRGYVGKCPGGVRDKCSPGFRRPRGVD